LWVFVAEKIFLYMYFGENTRLLIYCSLGESG